MSITKELREWIKSLYTPNSAALKDEGERIADRIDAEHERVCRDLIIDAEPMTDERMAEHGWVRMPRDAVGEYIHVGDVMEGKKICGGFGEPFEVVGYVMSNGELEPMDEHKCPRKREYLRHHREPTVEDVLREFAQAMNENLGMYTSEAISADEWRSADDETIAEYARRLALAGDTR